MDIIRYSENKRDIRKKVPQKNISETEAKTNVMHCSEKGEMKNTVFFEIG